MSLSILNDFCNWWWLWWIAPFLLGLFLGAVLWRRYLSQTKELQESLARHKSAIHGLEADVNNFKKNVVQKDVALEQAKADRTKLVQQIKRAQSAQSQNVKPIGSTVPTTKNQNQKPDNYSKLQPTNLQIIEGIGPKLEQILKSNGINDWKGLSSKSTGELKVILEGFGGKLAMIDCSSWPKQAFLAMNRDWDKLIKLQKENGSGSKLKKIMKRLGLT